MINVSFNVILCQSDENCKTQTETVVGPILVIVPCMLGHCVCLTPGCSKTLVNVCNVSFNRRWRMKWWGLKSTKTTGSAACYRNTQLCGFSHSQFSQHVSSPLLLILRRQFSPPVIANDTCKWQSLSVLHDT